MGKKPKKLNFATFHDSFNHIVSELNPTWQAVGFITDDDKILPFGTDTKVLSTIFESHCAPIILRIAKQYGYDVEGAPQTVYPDFTLTQTTGNFRRIAIDVKTTYRSFNKSGSIKTFRYTLGSYTSFLRTPGAKKNILHPYKTYSEHWVIGFLYTRTEGVESKVYHRDELKSIEPPYRDVEYFIQEKYKIVGLSPASGNTANMGSFPTNNIDDLRQGKGPFVNHGKEVCDDYWRHFAQVAANREYSNVDEFLRWRRQQR